MKICQKSKVVIIIIILLIIITGIVVCSTKGFNFEEKYSSRQQIRIDNNTEIEIDKIKEIAEGIITDRKITVNKVEFFGNSAVISAKNISEEEKNNIINKINEAYSTDIESDNINIISIAHTRISDILKKYVLASVISLSVIAIYSIIRYRKLGAIKILAKIILIPIIGELTYYSLIAITRLPFGDITTAIAIAIYVLSILILTFKFEKELEKISIEENKE